MIKRISATWPDAYHESNVAFWVDKLKNEGFEVYEIKNVSRIFGMWGTNITDIYYKKNNDKN